MPRFLDRTNMRYGRLLVIKHAGKDKRNKHLWLCKCDCGNEKIVVGDNLSSGKSNSCGCLKYEFLHKRGNQWGLYEDREDAIFKVQYSHLKRRNNRYGGDIISFDEFKQKSKQPCFYCGLEYSKILEDRLNETIKCKKLSDTVVKINGIDRLNSNMGYSSNNTVPCCKYCNMAKNTMTVDDFKKWVSRVYENFIK